MSTKVTMPAPSLSLSRFSEPIALKLYTPPIAVLTDFPIPFVDEIYISL